MFNKKCIKSVALHSFPIKYRETKCSCLCILRVHKTPVNCRAVDIIESTVGAVTWLVITALLNASSVCSSTVLLLSIPTLNPPPPKKKK